MSKAGLDSLVQKAMADESFRKKIKENPDAALAGYDLTAEEKAAIKSGNAAKLRELGGDERITKPVLAPPQSQQPAHEGGLNRSVLGSGTPDEAVHLSGRARASLALRWSI